MSVITDLRTVVDDLKTVVSDVVSFVGEVQKVESEPVVQGIIHDVEGAVSVLRGLTGGSRPPTTTTTTTAPSTTSTTPTTPLPAGEVVNAKGEVVG